MADIHIALSYSNPDYAFNVWLHGKHPTHQLIRLWCSLTPIFLDYYNICTIQVEQRRMVRNYWVYLYESVHISLNLSIMYKI